jgi:Ca-activated chloride channel homolog
MAALGVALMAVIGAIIGLSAQPQASVASNAGAASLYTLRVLAGSELGGMAKILAQAAASTGVRVKLTTIGVDSFTAAQELADGTAQRDYDAVWFGSDDYFGIFPLAANDFSDQTPIMSSPVVLAVRSSVARRLGWANGSATWQEITEAANSGDFTFGMASPATAEPGVAGLVAVATATARAHGPLQAGQIQHIAPELTSLFQKQVMSAQDSVDLTQAYLKDLQHADQRIPDGIIDDEADLIVLKAAAPATDPITLVYPSNGVVEPDYPLTLLTTAPPAARSAFERLVGYLTSPSAQRQIMTTTHYRPVAGLPKSGRGPAADLKVLPAPAGPATLQQLIELYLSQYRAQARTVFVLDTSYSMRGPGIAELKTALSGLTGAGAGLAGTFSEFRDGEQVTFLPFRTTPLKEVPFTIPSSGSGPVLGNIRTYIQALQAGQHTDIWGALEDAYGILKKQGSKDPDLIDSIILITDGRNTNGPDLHRGEDNFTAFYNAQWADSVPAPVYVIAVGSALTGELGGIADLTGGTLSNGGPPGMLDTIVEDIRGYQ